jgi:hypothetical protein
MLFPRKTARALALFLTVGLLSFTAQSKEGGKPDRNSDKAKPAAAPAVPQFAGKLVTRGNQPVLVNGYIVGTGTTILTGATVQTFNGTKATVRLGTMGSFELSANSTATLAFSGDQVTGMLKRGCAMLTTNPSIAGTLRTPDGMLTKTDYTKLSTVNVCVPGSDETAAADPIPDLNNAAPPQNNRRLGGISPWGLLGAASYAVGVGTARGASTANHNDMCCCCCCCNPSPSSP